MSGRAPPFGRLLAQLFVAAAGFIGTVTVCGVYLAPATQVLESETPSQGARRSESQLSTHPTDVTLSVTTTPARILDFPRVAALWDLRLSESLNVTRIVVHVPPTLIRTGERSPSGILGAWQDVHGSALDPRIVVNEVFEDAGPLNKWAGVSTAALHPESVVIVVEDDAHYGHGHLGRLYSALLQAEATLRSRGNARVGTPQDAHGEFDGGVDAVAVAAVASRQPDSVRDTLRWPRLNGRVSSRKGWPATPQPLVGVPQTLRHDDFDFVEAFGGVAVRVKSLSPAVVQHAKALSKLSKACWESDDVVVSAALSAHAVLLLRLDPPSRTVSDGNFHGRPLGSQGATGFGGHRPFCISRARGCAAGADPRPRRVLDAIVPGAAVAPAVVGRAVCRSLPA